MGHRSFGNIHDPISPSVCSGGQEQPTLSLLDTGGIDFLPQS